MPKLKVPAERFRRGDFPPVCAHTGGPATTTRRLVVVRRGGVSNPVARRRLIGNVSRIAGELPFTEPAARRTGVIESVRGALAAVAVVGFVVGIFVNVLVMLAAIGLAVALGLSLLLTVGGELDRTGDTVTLLHVHPEFVAAVLRTPAKGE